MTELITIYKFDGGFIENYLRTLTMLTGSQDKTYAIKRLRT